MQLQFYHIFKSIGLIACLWAEICCVVYESTFTLHYLIIYWHYLISTTSLINICAYDCCVCCEQIINYMSIDWTGSLELTSDLEEFKAINMESDGSVDGQSKQLSLSIYVCQRLSLDLYVYSPYWILNKTSLPIQIRVRIACGPQALVLCFVFCVADDVETAPWN